MDFELPDLIEFEAFEDLLEPEPVTKSVTKRRQSSLTEPWEFHCSAKRLLFSCRVCRATFISLEACEHHLLNKGHVYPLIDLRCPGDMTTETTDDGVLPWLSPLPPPPRDPSYMNSPDFLPVHVGRWSKVSGNDDTQAFANGYVSCPAFLEKQPDATQTQPKSLADIDQAIKKLNECFQTRSLPPNIGKVKPTKVQTSEDPQTNCPTPPPSADGEKRTLDFTDFLECSRSEKVVESPLVASCHADSPVPNEAAPSECPDVLLGHGVETAEPVGKHKVRIDFESKVFVCDDCGQKFSCFEQAAKHWSVAQTNEQAASSRVAEAGKSEGLPKKSTADDKAVDSNNEGGSEVDRCSKEVQNTGEEENEGSGPGELLPDRSEETSFDNSWLDKLQEASKDGGNSPKESFSQPETDKEKLIGGGYAPYESKSALRKTKKAKKRKRNKPWRYVKRAFMLTVTFLF